jgi:uncharacterized membrane protein HdeD (DUF308 family)
MEESMVEQAKATLQKSVPWRRGLAWWIVGIEGLLLVAAGIYVVAAPDDAKDAVRVIIGAFVLANSIGSIMAGFRPVSVANPITPYRMLAAGSGLTVGIIVVLQPWTENITDNAARVILALGLLVFGSVGFAGSYATRAAGGVRRGALIICGLSILFAALLFYNVRNEALDMRWFGYTALAAGVLICGYAFALYKARQTTPEVPAEPMAAEL